MKYVSWALIILLVAYFILYNNFAETFTVPEPSIFLFVVWFVAMFICTYLGDIIHKRKPVKIINVKVVWVGEPGRNSNCPVTFLFPDGKKRRLYADRNIDDWHTLIKGETVQLKYQGDNALSFEKVGVRSLPKQQSRNGAIAYIGLIILVVLVLYSCAVAFLSETILLPQPSTVFAVICSSIAFILMLADKIIQRYNLITVTKAEVLEIKENSKGACTIEFLFSDKKKHILKAAKNEYKSFKKGDSVELIFQGGTVRSMKPLIVKPTKPKQSTVNTVAVKQVKK